jgi:hypothetical protein
MGAEENYYNEFNKFQTNFFTNIEVFEGYSNYEVGKFGYVLINNIAKGFPNLADIISNLKGLNWSGVKSPALLKALQRRFVNKHVNVRIPNFVYFKNMKPEKETTKARASKKSKDLLDFDLEIQTQICSILKYDTKTYEYLKYSEKVQFLGRQLLGEFVQAQRVKKTKKQS